MSGDELPPIVVMGVSASGKSSVGAALADRLGLSFVDGDDLHPRANVVKMSAGEPLTDDDRRPWIEAVADRLAEGAVVVACSALKRAYRDRLRARASRTVFVHLAGSVDVLARRIGSRPGHFMPASLLQSQLDTLEALGPDEPGFTLDLAASPAAAAESAAELLTAGQREGRS